jgi:DNA-binding MarR family transcriptional regulator
MMSSMSTAVPTPARKPAAAAPCLNDGGCAADGVALDADLGWGLGVVYRSYLKAAQSVTADVPGGPRGYQVLASALRGLQGTQLALAQQLGVDRTVMTYLLDDLERAGLLERQPDPADRRARRVVLTHKGHTLVAALQLRLRQAEHHVLAALTEPDRDTFRAMLRHLATQAGGEPRGDACAIAEEIEAGETPRR